MINDESNIQPQDEPKQDLTLKSSTKSSKLPKSNSSLRLSSISYVNCEFCGLRYNNVQNKNTHQIYYCLGRDFTVNKTGLNFKKNNIRNLYKNRNSLNMDHLKSESVNNLSTLKSVDDQVVNSRKSPFEFEIDMTHSNYSYKPSPTLEKNLSFKQSSFILDDKNQAKSKVGI